MKMTIIIKFDSDESDGNVGVADEEAPYDRPPLASEGLFLVRHRPIKVRKDDPFPWKIYTIEWQ